VKNRPRDWYPLADFTGLILPWKSDRFRFADHSPRIHLFSVSIPQVWMAGSNQPGRMPADF
jgi:hypothetical protein